PERLHELRAPRPLLEDLERLITFLLELATAYARIDRVAEVEDRRGGAHLLPRHDDVHHAGRLGPTLVDGAKPGEALGHGDPAAQLVQRVALDVFPAGRDAAVAE